MKKYETPIIIDADIEDQAPADLEQGDEECGFGFEGYISSRLSH